MNLISTKAEVNRQIEHHKYQIVKWFEKSSGPSPSTESYEKIFFFHSVDEQKISTECIPGKKHGKCLNQTQSNRKLFSLCAMALDGNA